MLVPNPAPGYTRRQLLPGLPQGAKHGSALRRPSGLGLEGSGGVRWMGGAEGTNWSLRLRKGLRWPDWGGGGRGLLGSSQSGCSTDAIPTPSTG